MILLRDRSNLYGHYVPSQGAAIFFLIFFGILTLIHVFFIYSRKRKFPIIIVIGGLFEVIGHASRAYSRHHLSEIVPFSIQIILILLAPILFAAGIYMFLGRLIRSSGCPNLSPIRTTWITKIFLCGDIFCFLVQLAGASRLIKPKTQKDVKLGENIILGGLVLQIIIFLFFVVIAAIFHRRYRRDKQASESNGLLQQQLYTLYVCSGLVLVRSIFRLLEYKTGQNGYLMSHEWPAYTFDVALMAAVMAITLNWYRGSLEPDNGGAYSQELR
ncbi:RTA1 like protein [Paraphaeosphaeria sporulosa]|uniref:RTA1 like protein n=1 Tax=Paraphaeosphaeria sporulosa TaxID=1460663 RepID=A0A177D078_9PLEO|nr:RTA1 like protein [Paraphaeosphaeria sporulosa]OAG12530.1 RTA1 like protein [Paraphaeosphaeria sporulosa]